ncbi:hypothetical protein C8A05DRAFT_38036 [Staphylotrichum tortipilum]|uniref:Nuclear rim protein 1 n=1 Tax=Staphylotrichum tortipilum TaxID=2831512 RepID=A0AAN6ME45_9PEZI|nr:hypothetical protein C8A05DRAFT_38036 [Staphylotrichum longicolle]
MPSRPQRLVRRQPLSERIRAMLNPMDFYLWLSEEIQTLSWDSKAFGTRFGLAANFIFLLARANAGDTRNNDDIFADIDDESFWSAFAWFSILANFLQWTLIAISVLNAFYTMTRTRHYRFFEMNVEAAGPGTPSAQRVRVDSSPAASTPLRLIQEVLRPETADQRAHPDKTRDVWEMKVWDPYPATLRMFCLFSPGHVLIHMLFLPLPALDPRPSVTVFKCFLLQVILSAQLLLMHSRFSQQSKDTAIVQKEVMHEYDVKYVHPRMHPVVREAATQVSISDGHIDEEDVTVGTPATVISRSFQTHPNPNYSRYVNPDGAQQPRPMSPTPFTPSAKPRPSIPPSFAAQVQSHQRLRRSLPASTTTSTSTSTSTSTGTTVHLPPNPPPEAGLGGSLGVFTHPNSPLKKATSLGDIGVGYTGSPRNGREMAAREQRELAERMVRMGSPLKGGENGSRRVTMGGQVDDQGAGGNGGFAAHSPEKLARARANRWTQERFPTRWV